MSHDTMRPALPPSPWGRRLITAGLVAGLALAVAACGGDTPTAGAGSGAGNAAAGAGGGDGGQGAGGGEKDDSILDVGGLPTDPVPTGKGTGETVGGDEAKVGDPGGREPEGQDPGDGGQARGNVPGGDSADGRKPDAADIRARRDELVKVLADAGVELDLEARTVKVPIEVIMPADPLEYVLIHRRGKTHESVFVTDVQPSLLNSALLLLGLEPGKNASYVEKDPPPTFEEIERGVDPVIVSPPSGTEFFMTVEYPREDGSTKVWALEELIVDMYYAKPIREASWIYLGGRLAKLYRDEPEVFVADYEGNLVSVCYLLPSNHLATMRHPRARSDENWWFDETQMPPVGTKMKFVFHRDEPAVRKQWREHIANTPEPEPWRVRAEREAREAAEGAGATGEGKKDGDDGGGR